MSLLGDFSKLAAQIEQLERLGDRKTFKGIAKKVGENAETIEAEIEKLTSRL